MKILHVINSLKTGGAEKLLVDWVLYGKGMGVNMDVALLNGEDTPLLRRLRKGNVTLFLLAEGRYAEYSPAHIFRLHRLFKSYDIVHVHLFPAQYWAACAVLWGGVKKQVRLVTTEHSTFNTRSKCKLGAGLDRWIYGRYSAVAGISEAVSTFVRKRVPKNVPVYTVPNGVDLTRYRLETEGRRSIMPRPAFWLMQVARFEEAKNQDVVIRALSLLPDGICVAFVGDGSRLEHCKRLALETGVSDRVFFLGRREDIPALWSAVDVGVMASHWEGFGLAAVEGMAAGKPVIVSRVEGLSDIVSDERLQFEPDNARDLADKVLSLYENPDLRKELSDEASSVARKYDLSAMVEGYMNVYDKVIGR